MISVDIAVLGAGSGGERTATLLADAGHTVAIVERRLVGGECPFYACIPSKAMLISASARAALADAHGLGATGEPVDIGSGDQAWALAVRRRDEIADHHDDGKHVQELEQAGVRLVRGTGRIRGPGSLVVSGDDDETELAYHHLVIATGSTPLIPDVPGLQEIQPWTFQQAWATRVRPKSMLILGGGAVGCEIAQTFARFGTAVTIIDHGDLGGGLEPEIAEDLARVLSEDGVEVLTGAKLESVSRREDGTVVALVGGTEHHVEELVVAAGMRPRLADLGLDTIGLDIEGPDGRGLELDELGRVQGLGAEVQGRVWAVGDVNGLEPFTHTANREAAAVADNISGGRRICDYSAIPSAIYTSPAVAATGMTRRAAEEAGHDVVSTVFDLRDTARMFVGGQRAGRLVMVADRSSGKLLGASLIGPAAAESISEFSLAISSGLTVADVRQVVHPFPTWSEGFGPALDALASELG